MKPEVLLGDEAVALAAIHSGLSAAYSYPGTPASEILEYLLRLPAEKRGCTAAWSVNEKTAYEEALGASFAGRRAMVSMKHVGLNVAADPFMNSALTGAEGGLLVVAADDPGMHSSQNEQDSRYYADFARIFCFEPSGHQEAYDMTREAFDFSEKFDIPIMLRLTTRISHSRSVVVPREPRTQNPLRLGRWQDWTLLPSNARRRFQQLLKRQRELLAASEASAFNALTLNPSDRGLGVIATGIAWNYVQENLRGLASTPSLLKIGTYPAPESLIRRLVDHVDRVLVAEEGYPLVERMLRGLYGVPGKTVLGRMSGELPASGELTPDHIRSALSMNPLAHYEAGERPLAERPPQLCAGCPHTDTLKALNEALRDRPGSNVFSDIGCYTLGALPPLNAIQTCVCMGASISMAHGGSDAGIRPSVAVIGDSTFGHSGITSLLSAARADTDMTAFILDNGTVAMTGGQTSHATGPGLLKIIEGVGVPPEHIRVIEPLPKHHERNVRIIREELDHKGLSVIVAVRECVTYSSKRRG
ncbi:MAG: indolepyruvate ferredoxin oxidoreductase [Candidatus Aminicenantes bacterium]|nr:indolepyruvate ferredoxin oxidoreductase [Candidatus Aminicenantes bacterium]